MLGFHGEIAEYFVPYRAFGDDFYFVHQIPVPLCNHIEQVLGQSVVEGA